MRRQVLGRVTIARACGIAALAVLVAGAADGARLSVERATESVSPARADYEYQACMEAALRAAVPAGSVVVVEDDPAWWWAHQRLVEWASPDWLVVADRSEADVVLGIAPEASDCGNGRITVTAP